MQHGPAPVSVGGGLQRGGLGAGDWMELNGPFNLLLTIDAITFGTSGGTAGGSTLVASVTIAGTASGAPPAPARLDIGAPAPLAMTRDRR